jgi:sulfopyruvate decarboxylase subunit alpha
MMTTASENRGLAVELAEELVSEGFDAFFGTPCGILAPLYAQLERKNGLLAVSREDNAVGLAAGAALAGRTPAVLMQNSGLGQSINALASLVLPYRIAMLLVVSLRGTDLDDTPENAVMGGLTMQLLDALGIPLVHVGTQRPMAETARRAAQLVCGHHRTAALLIRPSLFGWNP